MNPAIKTIEAREAAIAKERQTLDEEARELAVAKRVLLRLSGDAPSAPPAKPAARVRSARGQADMVTDALLAGPVWQTQDEIADAVEILDRIKLKHSSLQPLLSKMKSAGTVVKSNGKFALIHRVNVESPRPDFSNSFGGESQIG